MRFVIDPSLAKISPNLSTAWVRIQLSQQAKADPSVVESLKADALSSLLDRIPSGQNADLEQIPSIQQWMQTYRAMKVNPKKIKPTHYAFSTRLLKDKKWPRSIGPLVDTYLTNQLKHILPHGGFDVTSLSGDTIRLLVSDVEQKFQPLGVKSDDESRIETTKVGEVLYQDISQSSKVTLTRYLNYRDSEQTKIDDAEEESNSTKDFVLIMESVDSSEKGKSDLEETANDLEKAYRKVYGEGVVQSFVRIVSLAGGEDEAVLSLDF